MIDISEQILAVGYLGFDPLDVAGRMVRIHPDCITATRHAQPNSRIFLIQLTLSELLDAGALVEVME